MKDPSVAPFIPFDFDGFYLTRYNYTAILDHALLFGQSSLHILYMQANYITPTVITLQTEQNRVQKRVANQILSHVNPRITEIYAGLNNLLPNLERETNTNSKRPIVIDPTDYHLVAEMIDELSLHIQESRFVGEDIASDFHYLSRLAKSRARFYTSGAVDLRNDSFPIAVQRDRSLRYGTDVLVDHIPKEAQIHERTKRHKKTLLTPNGRFWNYQL